MTLDQPPPSPNDPAARRPFLIRLAAIVSGAIVALFPFAAGSGVLLNPLWRSDKSRGGSEDADLAKYIRICTLDSLPADGVPRSFPVITDIVDAWTRIPNQRIGMVFLSRADASAKAKITAFTATCPHLGCAVEFNPDDGHFECPCHGTSFAKDGAKLYGPSLRGLDSLPAKVRSEEGQEEIWVAFEKFQSGIAERIPVG